MIDVAELQWVSIDELTRPVRELTGAEDAAVTSWDANRLLGGGEGIGVWRIAGEADVNGISSPWSLVVKGWNAPDEDAGPRCFNWPHREMELYRSGVLTDLPGGVRAPACYGSLRGEDGSVWDWLEDVTGDTDGPWTMDDHAAVARRLGQFNGAYVNGVPLPGHRALSQGWVRQWTEAAGPTLEMLVREVDHPTVQQVYPPDVIKTSLRLWERRHDLLGRLDRMPRTFCHEDAFQRNIFMRKQGDIVDDVILIDWSFAGIGALGEELSSLVVASVMFMDTPVETIRQLSDTVLQAYIAGLRDAGWQGDEQDVRDGYLITTLLRNGIGAMRVILPVLLDVGLQPRIEHIFGHPFHEIAATLAAVIAWIHETAQDRPDLL